MTNDEKIAARNSILLSTTDDELIRHRVREELRNQTEQGSRLWNFLNSSLGIWVLSSLLLSGLTLLYTEYSTFRTEQVQAQNRLTALQDEIAYRLDSDLVSKIFDSSGQGASIPATFHVAVLCLPADQFGPLAQSGTLTSNPSQSIFAQSSLASTKNDNIENSLLAGRFIHTEFRNRSIFSLIWELQQREQDINQSKLIDNALAAISALRKDALSNSGTKPALEYLEPVDALISSWR